MRLFMVRLEGEPYNHYCDANDVISIYESGDKIVTCVELTRAEIGALEDQISRSMTDVYSGK